MFQTRTGVQNTQGLSSHEAFSRSEGRIDIQKYSNKWKFLNVLSDTRDVNSFMKCIIGRFWPIKESLKSWWSRRDLLEKVRSPKSRRGVVDGRVPREETAGPGLYSGSGYDTGVGRIGGRWRKVKHRGKDMRWDESKSQVGKSIAGLLLR